MSRSQRDAKSEFLVHILTNYIDRNSTQHMCIKCGAYKQDHNYEDCPVKLAAEILTDIKGSYTA